MSDKLVVNHLFKVFGPRPDEAMALVRDGLHKDEIFQRTGHTIGVNDASFTVREGEIFVVMGLSGSGKSTLVRLLNRLIEPSAGEILVDGRDIAKLSPPDLRNLRRKDMSMVFQSFALMPHLTVAENTAFGMELAGLDKEARRRRAIVALEQVGLGARIDSYPSQLSGGMQQRVGLARALANDPSIMLMDEAFSALDPLIRAEMQDELLKLQDESKRTIIFISHDLDEAMRIGDRIAIMEGGSIVQIGTPDDILRNPADDYVRSFFRGVDVSKVLTAADIAKREQVTVIDRADFGVRTALKRLQDYDRDYGFVIDRQKRFHGIVTIDSLRAALKAEAEPRFSHAFISAPTIASDTLLSDMLGPVAESPTAMPVVDDQNRYLGAVSKARLLQTLDNTGEA